MEENQNMSATATDFTARGDLVFLIPVFNEGMNLDHLVASFSPLWEETSAKVIFVDDGSIDDTLIRLKELREKNPRIHYVELTRNFGKDQAMSAGLQHVPDEANLIVMDGDGQHTPQAVRSLLKAFANADHDIVFGLRRDRKYQSRRERMFAKLLFWFLSFEKRISVNERVSDFFVANGRYVNSLRKIGGHRNFWKGNYAYLGYKSGSVEIDIEKRFAGQSKFKFRNQVSLALDGIVNVTKFPLRMIGVLGVVLCLLSLAYICVIFYEWFAYGKSTPGFYTIICVNLFIGGFLAMCIAIMAEYISLIVDQTSNKPPYIVRDHSLED